MKHEFKVTKSKEQTVYTLESASSGGTSSGSVASVTKALGGVQRRPTDSIFAQEAKKEEPKPRNFVAKNAKMGVIGLTKALAKEVASRGITVNAVTPGLIETDMTRAMTDKAENDWSGQIPLGRIGTAADVAAAVCFLASDEASYITGHVLAVNGGMYM